MSLIYFGYLFDVEGYRAAIQPILPHLNAGDFQELRLTATKLGNERLYIWRLLNPFRYYHDDLGNEEEEWDNLQGRVCFWMMVVLASHCQYVTSSSDHHSDMARLLNEAHLQEEEAFIVVGRHLSQLLLPVDRIGPSESNAPLPANVPFWCDLGNIGWLGSQDIVRITSYSDKLKNTLLEVKRRNPDEYWGLPSTYDMFVHLMSIAKYSGRGLLQGIVM